MPGSPAMSRSARASSVVSFHSDERDVELLVSTDEAESRTWLEPGRERDSRVEGRGGRQRIPADVEDGDGLGQALEVVLAGGFEPCVGPGAGNGPHDQTAENLATLGKRADPSRLIDGGAVEIGALVARVTEAHADPDGERLLADPVATLDRLLDRDRRRDGIGSAAERDERPIPVPLTISPPCAAAAATTIPSCSRLSASPASSPRRVRCSVDPTRSVNTIVQVPSCSAIGADTRTAGVEEAQAASSSRPLVTAGGALVVGRAERRRR